MSDFYLNPLQHSGGSGNEDQRAMLEAFLRATGAGGSVNSSSSLGSPSLQPQQPPQQQVSSINDSLLAQARALLASSSGSGQLQQQIIPQVQPQFQQQAPLSPQPQQILQQLQAQSPQQPQQIQQQQLQQQPCQLLTQALGALLQQQQQQEQQKQQQQQQHQQQVGANNASKLLASLLLTSTSSGGSAPGTMTNRQQQQQQQQGQHFIASQPPAAPHQIQLPNLQPRPQPQAQVQPQQQQHQLLSLQNTAASANPAPSTQALPQTGVAQQLAVLLASEPNAIALLQQAIQAVSTRAAPAPQAQNAFASNQGQNVPSQQLLANLIQMQQQQQQQPASQPQAAASQPFNSQFFVPLQNQRVGQQPQQQQQQQQMVNSMPPGSISLPAIAPAPGPSSSDPSLGLFNLASAAAAARAGNPAPASEKSGSSSVDQQNNDTGSADLLLANVPALPAELVEMQKKKPRGRAAAFPRKLFQMLTELEEQQEGSDIASFLLPHGRS